MSDFPASKLKPLVTINTFSLESLGPALTAQGMSFGALGSAVYPSANLAILIPFVLAVPVTVKKLFSANGTVVSGNVDIGIYTSEGGASPVLTKIASMGSTAQAGTNSPQEFDITDTQLPPGAYYLAIVLDNITGTLQRANTVTAQRAALCGVRFKTSAFPLPATITAPDDAQVAYVPLIGLTTRTVI